MRCDRLARVRIPAILLPPKPRLQGLIVGRLQTLHRKILLENSNANIDFDSLCNLLSSLGFDLRIKGSHHVFTRSNVAEIISLQPKGGKAKTYQVRQVRQIFRKYRIEPDDAGVAEAGLEYVS